MDVATLRLCLKLHSLQHVDDAALTALLQFYGSPSALWESDHQYWPQLGLKPAACTELDQLRQPAATNRFDIEGQVQSLLACEATVLPICDDRYPALLRTIFDPPPLLYARGQLQTLQRPSLAVVGSRRASSVALRAAAQLSHAAVESGLQISSGLALGVDGAAHRGAMDAGGASLGVMATGIEQVYPRRHRLLAQEMLERGCLLTEFPPFMAPLKHNFPRRNRVISGVSLGVLVVEAGLRSGSLITARTALEQGREVFALPWSPFHAGGAGCLRLLREGAKMVETLQDILEELGPLVGLQRDLFQAGPAEPTSQPESALLRLIGCEVVSIDQLVADSQLTVPEVLAELSALELRGKIVQSAGGYTLR